MNTKSLQGQLKETWQSIMRLRTILFVALVVVICGFIGWRITTLANAEPSAATVDSKASKTSELHVDQAAVDQIKQLEGSNINVQTLFNEARQNPFRE